MPESLNKELIMLPEKIELALTFDDLLLIPSASEVLPNEVSLATRLTDTISLNAPLISAAMDTVTEHRTAITMAREGGIGIIHKNMGIDQQVLEVEKVKKSESGMIIDPITVTQNQSVGEVQEIMSTYKISGLPVLHAGKLVGIVTNRDLRFVSDTDLRVSDVMTSKNLVTAKVGIDLAHSKALLHEHRIEKLLVVDDAGNLKGLITIKDLEKIKKYPLATKDGFGRLRVAAAVGAVVSKPTARKTTFFAGLAAAISRLSNGEYTIWISAPSAFLAPRLDDEPGTLSMSPKVVIITSSERLQAMALSR